MQNNLDLRSRIDVLLSEKKHPIKDLPDSETVSDIFQELVDDKLVEVAIIDDLNKQREYDEFSLSEIVLDKSKSNMDEFGSFKDWQVTYKVVTKRYNVTRTPKILIVKGSPEKTYIEEMERLLEYLGIDCIRKLIAPEQQAGFVFFNCYDVKER